MTLAYIISFSNTIQSNNVNSKFGYKVELKRPVFCSEHAIQSPPCCQRCLTNRSVRGYEKGPQHYFHLLKRAGIFFFYFQSHLGSLKGYMNPTCMTALNKSNNFSLISFLFEGKGLVWIALCYVCSISKQSHTEPDLWSWAFQSILT